MSTRTTRPRPPRTAAGQGGSISATAPLLVLVVLTLVGFAYDSGVAMTAHRRAVNLAEQAARAGAQQLDVAVLRATGVYRLDHAAATRAATAYLTATGTPGQARVGRDPTGDFVEVTVSWSTPAVFARLIGRARFSGSGTATARNCHGLVTEEGC